MRRLLRVLGVLAALGALAIGGLLLYARRALAPALPGEPFYFRVDEPRMLPGVLGDLQARGVVRDPQAAWYYARWVKASPSVGEGTYELRGGMDLDSVFKALGQPLRQMVRLPETTFSWRVAPVLAEKEVGDPQEYLELIEQPQRFAWSVGFPLPTDSLEGYLFPDTYDLPPLLGASKVIERQLRAFEDKAMPLLAGKDVRAVLTVASMVEMEAASDAERPRVAGVIFNRLKKAMPLQIDATVLFALKEVRRLAYADYRAVDSPYNTYLHAGLPPGPICSPSLASIRAATHPEAHNYLYYVAMADGTHRFASTYNEHLRNVRARNAASR